MHSNDLSELSLEQLRRQWKAKWGLSPHKFIGRVMLEKSLEFKLLESDGYGLNLEQKEKLDKLIQDYKKNPKLFDHHNQVLKPGTKLVRTYKGKKYSVIVKDNGFEYDGQIYSSLTKIANNVTGTHWNGLVFFGLKKATPR